MNNILTLNEIKINKNKNALDLFSKTNKLILDLDRNVIFYENKYHNLVLIDSRGYQINSSFITFNNVYQVDNDKLLIVMYKNLGNTTKFLEAKFDNKKFKKL
jgi:hypothetical protein